MKYFQLSKVILVLFLVSTSFMLPLRAQKLSKEERKALKAEEKELKKEVKAYSKNLQAFKAFKEDKARAESEVARLNTELTRVKELEAQCAKEVEELRREIEGLMARIDELKDKPKGFSIPTNGLYYAVQIGAFQSQNIPTTDENPDFRKEYSDGFNKYIMGVFDNLPQADELKSFLMQLDFRSDPNYQPFVVPYRNGQRVSMDDALGPEEAERRRQQLGQ